MRLSKNATVKINNLCQQQALGEFLSDWDNDLPYDEIIDRLDNDNLTDDTGEAVITVWEPFENKDGSYVSTQIDNAYNAHKSFANDIIKAIQ